VFPYIFRGALDAGASTITDEMEIAAVHAIAELAQAEQSEVVAPPTPAKSWLSVPNT
jgi:malate dehydrogenase (oxaloacetate-decarboxylating)(NADP+)